MSCFPCDKRLIGSKVTLPPHRPSSDARDHQIGQHNNVFWVCGGWTRLSVHGLPTQSMVPMEQLCFTPLNRPLSHWTSCSWGKIFRNHFTPNICHYRIQLKWRGALPKPRWTSSTDFTIHSVENHYWKKKLTA